MHIIQSPLFDFEAFIRIESNDRLVIVLEALDAEKLLATLEREHWTGRKGYPVRGMWSALIAGVLNQCHSQADVIRMLERDKDTRMVCGFSKDDIPSVVLSLPKGEDALGRFLKKLVRHDGLLQECFEGLVEKLRLSRFPCSDSSYGYVLKLPILKNLRLHPPVPRESKKWKRLYKLRIAVERVNSRIKGLLGLEHITVRGIAKVMVRSLLSLLVMVAIGVGMAQRHRLKEVRTLVG